MGASNQIKLEENQNIEYIWKHYELNYNLYQKYLDIALKFLFFVVTTTSIFIYYTIEKSYSYNWVLYIIAVIIFLFFILIDLYAIKAAKISRADLRNIAFKVFNFKVCPDYSVLIYLLYLILSFSIIIIIILIVLIIKCIL
jgi:hypothetical protein